MNGLANRTLSRARAVLAVAGLGLLAAACGGGAPTVENPVTAPPTPAGYKGPPPASQDVQAFKLNVWDNLMAANRCGQCHVEGQQSPQFVRSDDVNLAYAEANAIVDLNNPGASLMVTKVAGGHNCWLANDSACGDQLTVWIRNWASATVGGTRQIVLQAPPLRDVGASKSFPADAALFATTIHPVLTEYCTRCHVSGSTTPQSPFFAEADAELAYSAARSKINLDNPADSRFVVRLRDEFHNCWSNCAQDSAEMQAAIQAFSDGIPLTEVDPSLVLSKALTLYDGTVASGGNRYDSNLVALYEFKTGTGTVTYDTSGVEPAINLNFAGDVTWVGGWGVKVGAGGKLQGSTASSTKLNTLIQATGEYSIEAWVAPANVVQENSHIVGYSGGTMARNFTLGQTMYDYDFFNRSASTDANGDPALSTPSADEVLQATLQHVVATYSPVDGRRIYVNGDLVTGADPQPSGTLADWNDTFALVLGNEVSGDRQWTGVMRLVGIHNRALNQEQIQQNFEAGVGERFYLLFNVEDVTGVPDGYVMFEVSQFDSFAYLFEKPVFMSLDGTVIPDNVVVRGMRIGINGAEARVGQAYANVDAVVNAAGYDPATGFPLADIGTVIALDKGPAYDLFFLTFEQLGDQTHVFTEPAPLVPPPPPDGAPMSEIGLRTFDELSATMSLMTGVSRNNPAVADTYGRVRQQLPTVENIEGFVSAHQVGLAQLAIEYCNELVEDAGLRSSFFPGLNFGAPAGQAFDTQGERDLVIDPLVARAVGTGIQSQPDVTEVRTELNGLITRLASCGGSCAADRTETIVKASCAAVLGGASTLVQ